MSTGRGPGILVWAALAALAGGGCEGGGDDDGDDGTPTVDADPSPTADAGPGDPDASGPTADAGPEDFPILLFTGSNLQLFYGVNPANNDLIVATDTKFGDEDPDDFAADVGVIFGSGATSRHVADVPFLDSATVRSDNGHLVATMTAFNDLSASGAPIFNYQPFLYDVELDSFARIANGMGGTIDDWGGSYPVLAGDGKSVFYQLTAAPGMTHDVNALYKQLLVGTPAQPGQSLAPLSLASWSVPSHDGRLVVFATFDNLVAADSDGLQDIYVFDTQTESYVLVSAGAEPVSGHAAVARAGSAGYRVAYYSQDTNYATVMVCDDVLSGTPECKPAGSDLIECGTLCPVEISPNGRWLGISTMRILDPRDEGGLSDIYRIDLDALFASAPHAPVFMSPTPPDYTSPVSNRFNAAQQKMLDDGAVVFMDTYGGLGMSIWRSPAY